MLQPGRILANRYRIEHLIGEGGMAEVYAARHLLTEHAVAIKLLRPRGESTAGGHANFALEAKIDARVGSPHIVHVQDAGVDEETGAPYLVMELLRGRTLARLIQEQKESRLAVDPTLDILRQVALGLDSAHAYAVIHRDLKPENVFVTDASRVKILDFGIAKILDASAQVTQEVRGTPYYMAPEQAKGERVSTQTDVWALGLMAYRALTGRIYWRCANQAGVRAPSLAKIIYEITVVPRDTPSARLREQGVQLGLPEGFDRWFLRCVDSSPERRFPGAGVAVSDLARAFEHWSPEPRLPELTTQTPGPLELVTRPTRTYPRSETPEERASVSLSQAGSGPRSRGRHAWVALLLAAAVAALLPVTCSGPGRPPPPLPEAPRESVEKNLPEPAAHAPETSNPAPQLPTPARDTGRLEAAEPTSQPARRAAAKAARPRGTSPSSVASRPRVDIYGVPPVTLAGPRPRAAEATRAREPTAPASRP